MLLQKVCALALYCRGLVSTKWFISALTRETQGKLLWREYLDNLTIVIKAAATLRSWTVCSSWQWSLWRWGLSSRRSGLQSCSASLMSCWTLAAVRVPAQNISSTTMTGNVLMFCNLMNLMGERLEVNNGVGAPAVVGVQDEVSVEVTSIESGERQTIS